MHALGPEVESGKRPGFCTCRQGIPLFRNASVSITIEKLGLACYVGVLGSHVSGVEILAAPTECKQKFYLFPSGISLMDPAWAAEDFAREASEAGAIHADLSQKAIGLEGEFSRLTRLVIERGPFSDEAVVVRALESSVRVVRSEAEAWGHVYSIAMEAATAVRAREEAVAAARAAAGRAAKEAMAAKEGRAAAEVLEPQSTLLPPSFESAQRFPDPVPCFFPTARRPSPRTPRPSPPASPSPPQTKRLRSQPTQRIAKRCWRRRSRPPLPGRMHWRRRLTGSDSAWRPAPGRIRGRSRSGSSSRSGTSGGSWAGTLPLRTPSGPSFRRRERLPPSASGSPPECARAATAARPAVQSPAVVLACRASATSLRVLILIASTELTCADRHHKAFQERHELPADRALG